MRASLTRDLARWERGVLSAAELELWHPGRAVGLVAVYERLTDLGGASVPDPEAGWESLRERLIEHQVAVPVRTMGPAFSLRRLVARPLALAAALVLLGAAVGYASAPQAVNRRVASVWESVADFFRDDPSEDRPNRFRTGERPGVAPSDSDDGNDSDGRSAAGGDRREGGDDDREGSDEDSGGGSDDSDEGSDDDSGEGSDGDREGPATDDSDEGSDDDSGEDEEGEGSHEPQEPDTPDN
jgi:hypothetical protein